MRSTKWPVFDKWSSRAPTSLTTSFWVQLTRLIYFGVLFFFAVIPCCQWTEVGRRPKCDIGVSCRQVHKTKRAHYLAHYWYFHCGGFQSWTLILNISIILTINPNFAQKYVNERNNRINNDANKGNFERPYWSALRAVCYMYWLRGYSYEKRIL